MIKFFIEGKEVDIMEDVAVDLNYAIADIMELGKRNTQFSKTILLPNSKFNREIFGYIYDINVQNPYNETLPNIGLNFNVTKKAKAVIYKDNIAVFNGICRLISVVMNNGDIVYEVNLFGRLKDILYILGEKYIHELNWSDQNYIFDSGTWAYIYDSKRYNEDGNVIIGGVAKEFCMPMVDYGTQQNTAFWDWKDFKPNVFVREIMKRMFSFAGFVSDFSKFAPFFNTDYFKRLAITNGERGIGQFLKDVIKYNVQQEGFVNECTTAGQGDLVLPGSTTPCTVTNPNFYFYNYAKWNVESNIGSLFNLVQSTIPNTCGNVQRRHFEYIGTANVTFNLNVDMKLRVRNYVLQTLIGGQTANLQLLNNLITHTVSLVKTNAVNNVTETYWSQTRNLNQIDGTMGVGTQASTINDYHLSFSGSITMGNSERLQIRVEGISGAYICNFGPSQVLKKTRYEIDWTWNDYPGFIKVDFQTITFVPLSIGASVSIADQLPRSIKCVDLFKNIILMHNLYVEQDDKQDNLLHITPHPLYYDYDVSKCADWTYKLDRAGEIRIIPLSELKAQRYKFTYASDNDFFSEGYRKRFNKEYGEKQEFIENDFLDTEEEIKLLFAPSVIASTDSSNRAYLSLYKLDGVTKKPDKFKPRIGIYNGNIPTDAGYLIRDNEIVIYTDLDFGATYRYIGHLDNPINPTIDCNFWIPEEIYFKGTQVPPNNLYETFWKKLIAEISDKDSRLLIGNFDLDGIDVENLDFARLIKVDNQYYKLIKIENFDPNGRVLAKVSLLKVLYDTDFGELNYILQEDTNFLLQENGVNKFYI
jgi:hypothetical protein